MQDYVATNAAWQPFFTTLVSLCGTMAGLLFVSLTLHSTLLQNAEAANLRRLAQHTFSDFAQVLFIGLFFIVPPMSTSFQGISTLMVVVLGLPDLGRRFLRAWRDRDNPSHREHFFRRLGLSLLGRLLLVAGGGSLLFDSTSHGGLVQGLTFVFSGSTVLLMAAIRNAWFLLIHEAD